MPADVTLAIAEEINATRKRMGERTAHSEMALDILAMKVAGHLAQNDTRFNVNRFATVAGVPDHATHLV